MLYFQKKIVELANFGRNYISGLKGDDLQFNGELQPICFDICLDCDEDPTRFFIHSLESNGMVYCESLDGEKVRVFSLNVLSDQTIIDILCNL